MVLPAYRSKTDMWDRHYHEFEDWQLDWLLETGWKIIDSQKWTNPLINLVSAHYCVILPIDITSCMLKELKANSTINEYQIISFQIETYFNLEINLLK
jgi:hypothetical protein